MTITDIRIDLSDADLREIFSLFSSCTIHELDQVYDPNSQHFHATVDLGVEYELTQDRREYAIDSVRAVLFFLHRNGYALTREGNSLSLEPIRRWFIS